MFSFHFFLCYFINENIKAVLPASAKDTGRSVVSLTFADENKTFSIVSLKLDHNESQSIDVIIDEGSQVKFSVSGKNSVHLSGYYVPDENPEGNPLLLSLKIIKINTLLGIYDDDDEIDSDEVGDDDEMGMEDSDDDVDADIDSATRAKVEALMAKKRKAAPQNGAEANKKPKADAPQQQQPKKENKPTPTKPQQYVPFSSPHSLSSLITIHRPLSSILLLVYHCSDFFCRQEAKKPQQQQQQQKPQQKGQPQQHQQQQQKKSKQQK